MGIDQDRYFETYFSIFDGEAPLRVDHYPRNLELVEGLANHPPVVKLKWFTRGFYALAKKGDGIVVSDLRMGSEPDYVFRFEVAKIGNPHPLPVKDRQLSSYRDWRQLIWIWKRIWTPTPRIG